MSERSSNFPQASSQQNKREGYLGGVSIPINSSLSQIQHGSMSRISGVLRGEDSGKDSYTAPTAMRERTHSRTSSKGSYNKLSNSVGDFSNIVSTSKEGSGVDLERAVNRSYSENEFNTLWPVISRSRSSYSIHVLQDYTNGMAPAKGVKSPAGEGFLKDIELNGFSGMWNHPITRCYFLMYLIWSKQANLYVS
jgi:hypothetical protein